MLSIPIGWILMEYNMLRWKSSPSKLSIKLFVNSACKPSFEHQVSPTYMYFIVVISLESTDLYIFDMINTASCSQSLWSCRTYKHKNSHLGPVSFSPGGNHATYENVTPVVPRRSNHVGSNINTRTFTQFHIDNPRSRLFFILL